MCTSMYMYVCMCVCVCVCVCVYQYACTPDIKILPSWVSWLSCDCFAESGLSILPTYLCVRRCGYVWICVCLSVVSMHLTCIVCAGRRGSLVICFAESGLAMLLLMFMVDSDASVRTSLVSLSFKH